MLHTAGFICSSLISHPVVYCRASCNRQSWQPLQGIRVNTGLDGASRPQPVDVSCLNVHSSLMMTCFTLMERVNPEDSFTCTFWKHWASGGEQKTPRTTKILQWGCSLIWVLLWFLPAVTRFFYLLRLHITERVRICVIFVRVSPVHCAFL